MSAAHIRRFACLTALLPLWGWCAAPVVVADSIKIGDVVTGPLRIGHRTVVIPAGDWQVVSAAERPVTAGAVQQGSILTLHFQEIRNSRLVRGLEVAATKTSTNVRWTDEPCKSKGDSFWMEHRRSWIRNNMDDQFCMRVGYLTGVVDNARGDAFLAWARDIKAKSIGYSPEAPFVSVTRFTRYDYLRMSVTFDPMLAGIGPSKNPARQFNDWHGDSVSQRPAHAAYYAALVEWAPKFADAVQRAFEGDDSLSASDFGEPVLTPKTSQSAPATQPAQSPPRSNGVASATTAERLRELEALLKERLITQEEFAERRRRIIDGI